MSSAEGAPKGTRRRSKTRFGVRAADVVSRVLITACGIGTIVAVSTVLVFLIWVVVPLFFPATIQSEQAVTVPPETIRGEEAVLASALDEEQLMAWVLSTRGELTLFRLDNGEVLDRRHLFDGNAPTAASRPSFRSFASQGGKKITQQAVAFGFRDGTVRVVTLHIKGSYPNRNTLGELRDLEINQVARLGAGLVRHTPEGLFHRQELIVDVPEPAKSPSRSPVRLLDQTQSPTGPVVCVLTADGKLRFNKIRETTPPDPDLPVVRRLVGREIPFAAVDGHPLPDHMLLSEEADQLYLLWNTGRFARYDLRDPAKATVAERGSLIVQDGPKVTTVRQLVGRTTLLVGDSSGTVSAWFPAKPPNAGTVDGAVLVRGHQLKGPADASATSLDVSSHNRLVAIGYSNGQVRLYNVTSEKLVAQFDLGVSQRVLATALAPNADGLAALTPGPGRHWRFDPGHHEVSPGALFGKVWYEGSVKPEHKYQSTGGDSYEPKYGMVPLIFGTLKATFYSLLFGVPLALLAAIYTSEFMRPRARAIVKPVVETMASLPSVILGFLAGLVFAQFVEDKVPTILCAFLLVPLAFALVAQVVQLLPERVSLGINRLRFLFFIPSAALGLLGAAVLGPIVEKVFFAGDLRAWLEDRDASSVGGWMLLFLPLGMLLSAFLMGGIVTPRLKRLSARWSRTQAALLDLARFALGCLLAVGFALAGSLLLSVAGFDARGSYIDTYKQRNMLIAGFAMGFAIIPIIFTIADDALSAVPAHLRSGSLAAGATPWQTAVRIVLPTAMSGLFSAVMIGMGRAIGETMIMVMASGITPVMDWNVFSGCRTLAANIAVEVPEADRHSTLFSTLFVAALLLFAMTFVLNTIAEVVRLRFRRRAHQL